MLDQPVPNPLATNPKVHTHKVFASVGLILIGTIIAVAGIWWYVEGKNTDSTYSDNTISTTKVSTSSAKKDTDPETTNETPKDETADWKTYTNSELGFSVKYPDDWVQKGPGEGGPNDKNVNFYSADYKVGGGFGYTEDGILIYINSGGVYQGVNDIDSWVANTGYSVSNRKNIKVDTTDAARFDFVDSHGAKCNLIVIVRNSKITELWVTNSRTDEIDNKYGIDIFDNMVSTFKFL